VIQIALWKALYIGNSNIPGYSLGEMLTYQVLSAIIAGFLTGMQPMTIVQDDINTGMIVNYLKLPNSYQLQVLMKSLGGNLFSFIFVSIPMLVLSNFFTRIMLPASVAWFICVGFALLLSIGAYFELYYLFGILSFWFMDRYHTVGLLLMNVIRILSGAMIPLAFFPGLLHKVVMVLPMRFGFDFPISIYLGKIATSEVTKGFFLQIVWIIILWIVNQILFHFGLKKLILQGG
jgi:ABC-2 type transport system permease protein